jgi:hypothetical protein
MPKGNHRREAGKHGAPTPSSRNATPSPCGIRGRLKPIVERYVGDDVIDEMRRSLGLPAVRRSPRHWRLSAHCTALKNALAARGKNGFVRQSRRAILAMHK